MADRRACRPRTPGQGKSFRRLRRGACRARLARSADGARAPLLAMALWRAEAGRRAGPRRRTEPRRSAHACGRAIGAHPPALCRHDARSGPPRAHDRRRDRLARRAVDRGGRAGDWNRPQSAPGERGELCAAASAGAVGSRKDRCGARVCPPDCRAASAPSASPPS